MLSAFLLQANPTAAADTAGSPLTAYWPVMIFLAVAAVFPVLPVVLGRFVRPNIYGKAKMRPYECGIDPVTEAHDRFTVRYYIVAMLSRGVCGVRSGALLVNLPGSPRAVRECFAVIRPVLAHAVAQLAGGDHG